jgi:hypothetical protein
VINVEIIQYKDDAVAQALVIMMEDVIRQE